MLSLTIIIPVYNEEKRIKKSIDGLKNYRPPAGVSVEKIRFVDDGSTDKTVRQIKSLISSTRKSLREKMEIVSYQPNRGRGFAVKMGMKKVESDYVMYLDADMSIPLSNLKNFAKSMKKGEDILIGSKKMPQTLCLKKRGWIREFIGGVHSAILRKVIGVNLYDFTGGFKIFSRRVCLEVFPKLTMERWGLDPEVIFVANKMGYKIVELPIVWSHFSQSSKVNLIRDISRAFKEMAQIRVNHLLGIYDEKRYLGQSIPRLEIITLA